MTINIVKRLELGATHGRFVASAYARAHNDLALPRYLVLVRHALPSVQELH